MQPSEDGTQVLVGGRPAFLVTAADIDAQIGETTDNVAREAGKRLERAIVEHAEQRTPRYMIVAAAWVAGATILALLLLRGVVLVGRFVGARLSNVSSRRTQALHLQGVRLFDARHVDAIVRRTVQALSLLFAAFVIYGWLTFTLTRVPYTRPWGEQLEGRLVAIVLDAALSVVSAIPGLVIAFMVLVVARAITQLTGAFFDRIAQGKMNVGGLDADTARADAAHHQRGHLAVRARARLPVPAGRADRRVQGPVGAGRPHGVDRRVGRGRPGARAA